MTEDRLPLNELLQKAGDGDFLRAVAESALQLLMEADVEGLIGAGRHERTADRLNWRNGYRDRTLDTRLGSLNLKIPKLRAGSYFPPFLEARKTTEKALVAVIQEAWIGGVSTRRVDEIAQAMGLSGISKSQVSKLCKEIDERVKAFLERPLEGDWPYLWLDATYLKVREGGRIVSVAAIIAVAANTEGRREIVGLGIGPSEAETFWADFLKRLTRRGLRGVKLVISDAHEGLKAAVQRVVGATWQRCRVHFMRNALAYVPKTQETVVAAAIRQAFIQPDRETALSVVPDHALGHMWLGFVDICTKRGGEGIAESEHALALDRNLAFAHASIGIGKSFIGRAEETEAHIVEALRLSPRDTFASSWMHMAGAAKNQLGSWEPAVAWFRRSIEANRNYPYPHFVLGAALAQLGRLDEARSAVKAGVALNPSFTLSRARALWTAFSDDPTYLAQIEPTLDGLRKAGLPED